MNSVLAFVIQGKHTSHCHHAEYCKRTKLKLSMFDAVDVSLCHY